MTSELLRLGDETFGKQRYAEAAEIYMRAAEAAEAMGHPAARIEALAQVAYSHLVQGRTAEGLPWLSRAAALASPAEPGAWTRYLAVRGRFEWRDGRRWQAESTFAEAFRICMAKGIFDRAVDAAHSAGVLAAADAREAWARKAILAAQSGDLRARLGPLWSDLAWSLDGEGRSELALEAFVEAREAHAASADARSRLSADWAVGRAHRVCGDLATARAWQRETLLWAERRHAATPDAESAEWLGLTHWELGEIDRAEGALDAAQAHLSAASVHFDRADLRQRWPDGHARFVRQLTELRMRSEMAVDGR
jgi:tetratricopeptide (TPR) repeat protein